MRKVLLMLGLAMLGVMLFAPVALAEHTAAHVRAGYNGGPCSGDTPFEATRAGDPGEGSLKCFATQEEAAAYSGEDLTIEGCTHMHVRLPSGECVPVSDPRLDDASPSASPTASPSASPTASLSASPTASATPTASAPADSHELPDTGGPSTLALAAGALLIGGGLISGFLLRRS